MFVSQGIVPGAAIKARGDFLETMPSFLGFGHDFGLESKQNKYTKGVARDSGFHQSPQCQRSGGIAQLVERLVRNEKVSGSNPLTSTKCPRPKVRVEERRPPHRAEELLELFQRVERPRFFFRKHSKYR